MLTDYLPTLDKHIADWESGAWQRQIFGGIADVLKRDISDVIKDISDPARAEGIFRQYADAMRGAGVEEIVRAIDSKELTAKVLSDWAKSFAEKKKAVNVDAWFAQLYEQVGQHVSKWGAEWFGVKPEPMLMRFADTLKAAQSVILLGWNPLYALNNIINNTVTPFASGVFRMTTPNENRAWVSRFGIEPARMRSGFTPTGEAGATASSMTEPIRAAGRLAGPLDTAKTALRWLADTTGFASKLSQTNEVFSSEMATTNGIRQMWGRLWRPGTGYDNMPRNLRNALDSIDPKLTRQVNEAIKAGLTPAEIEGALYRDAARLGMDSFIPDVARQYGMSEADAGGMLHQLGAYDFLQERLKVAESNAEISKAFSDMREHVMDQILDMQEQSLMDEANLLAQRIGTEGGSAGFSDLNLNSIDETVVRSQDYREWQDIFGQREDLTQGEYQALIERQVSIERARYKAMYNRQRSRFLGVAKGLGLDNDLARGYINSIGSKEVLWQGFYKTKWEDMRQFYRTEFDSYEARSTAWHTLKTKHTEMYTQVLSDEMRIMEGMDATFARMIGEKYGAGEWFGTNAQAVTEGYLKRVRDVRDEMGQDMSVYQDWLLKQEFTAEQSDAAWTVFINETVLPQWVQKMNEALAGVDELWAVVKGRGEPGSGGAGEPVSRPPSAEPTADSRVWHEMRPPDAEPTAAPQPVEPTAGRYPPATEQIPVTQAELADPAGPVMEVASRYGISSADEAGEYVVGSREHTRNIINKWRTDRETVAGDYLTLDEISPEVAEAAFEARKAAADAQMNLFDSVQQQAEQARVVEPSRAGTLYQKFVGRDVAEPVTFEEFGRFRPELAEPLRDAFRNMESEMGTGGKPPKTLLMAIKELGGVDVKLRQDLTGETRATTGVPPGMFKVDGFSLDDLAVRLWEEGYLLEHEVNTGAAEALIMRALKGEEIFPIGYESVDWQKGIGTDRASRLIKQILAGAEDPKGRMIQRVKEEAWNRVMAEIDEQGYPEVRDYLELPFDRELWDGRLDDMEGRMRTEPDETMPRLMEDVNALVNEFPMDTPSEIFDRWSQLSSDVYAKLDDMEGRMRTEPDETMPRLMEDVNALVNEFPMDTPSEIFDRWSQLSSDVYAKLGMDEAPSAAEIGAEHQALFEQFQARQQDIIRQREQAQGYADQWLATTSNPKALNPGDAREIYRDALRSQFGLSDEQAEASMLGMDGFARAWARENKSTAAHWWQKAVAGYERAGAGGMFQEDYYGGHRPPGPDGGAPLHDLTGGGDIYPDDIYGPMAAQYYGHGGSDKAIDTQTIGIIQRMRGKPEASVSIYRAVPDDITVADKIAKYEAHQKHIMRHGEVPPNADTYLGRSEYYEFISNELDKLREMPQDEKPVGISSGDWVTINRNYAVEHGEGALLGNYKIIRRNVKAKEIFTNGDSIHEFGYWPDGYSADTLYQRDTPQGVFQRSEAGGGVGNELYQLGEQQPVWYSQLARVAESMPQETMQASQLKGWISKQAGVKGDELYWTGLADWLDGKGSEQVTRHEVGEYLRQNQVEVREGVRPNAAQFTKYSGWMEPGGENYREMLLTLPQQERPINFETWIMQEKKSGRIPADADIERFRPVYDRAVQMGTLENIAGAEMNYTSSHWDEKNVLAHVRFDDRVDADGKRVLFMEELQSDWHQEGKKEGYLTPVDSEDIVAKGELQNNIRELRSELLDARMRGDFDAAEDIGYVLDEYEGMLSDYSLDIGDAVPPAPFAKTWADLGMKRMVRWAAENGYERLAWTTGDMQAERYSNALREAAGGELTWNVAGEMLLDGNGDAMVMYGVTERTIADYVGKDMAKKLLGMEGNNRTVTGDDIKVGGAGHRVQYDSIMVKAADKLGKKFGVRVGETEIVTTPGYFKNERYPQFDNTSTVHSIDITPEMRASVMEGQPLFQGAKGMTRFTADGRAMISALSNPDFTTGIHEGAHIVRRWLNDADTSTWREWARVEATAEGWKAANSEMSISKDMVFEGRQYESFEEAEAVLMDEMFARGWERYAAEGIAPNAAMLQIFEKIKRWMMEVYRSIAGTALDVDLNAEMRAMFERFYEAEGRGQRVEGRGQMFGQADTPLFSGTAMRGEESMFRPAEQPRTNVLPGFEDAYRPQWKRMEDGGRGTGEWFDTEQGPKRLLQAAGDENISYQNADGTVEDVPANGEVPEPFRMPMDTMDNIDRTPPVNHMTEQGWNEKVWPMMKALEARMLSDDANIPVNMKNATLDTATAKQLAVYMQSVFGQMADTKLASLRWGENRRDATLLNYQRRYGMDNVVTSMLPYQFWYTRSAMQWALRAIDRPAWFANFARLRNIGGQVTAQPGFPSRLMGKMRVPLPFLPKWAGDSVYVDPLHQIFPFEQLARIWDDKQEQRSQIDRQASYIVQSWLAEEEVSTEQARQAITDMRGPVWERAVAEAKVRVEGEESSPFDFIEVLTGFSLPLSILSDVIKGTPEEISQLPITRLIQSATAGMTPGGFNIEGGMRRALGVPERGKFGDYFVIRELASMVATGEMGLQESQVAMVEKQGPAWDAAMSRVGKYQAMRYWGAALWVDFFPEGEEKQRAMQQVFMQAIDSEDPQAMTNFFEKYPEFEARLLMNNWDDPDEMMRRFLIGQVWDGYFAADDLTQGKAYDRFGPAFQQAFLNKETRSYDSIDTQTLATWAQMLGGETPGINREPMMEGLVDPKLAEAYQEYTAARDVRFDADQIRQLEQLYWTLPEEQQDKFHAAFPELQDYWNFETRYLAQSPELIPELGSSKIRDANPETQKLYQSFLSERLRLFGPDIFQVQGGFFDLEEDSPARDAYMDAHPELGQYWDWRRAVIETYPTIAQYVQDITNLGRGIEPVMMIDTTHFEPALVRQLQGYYLSGQPLGNGARAMLREVWEEYGRPGEDFGDFLDTILRDSMR
uniref:Large polyvalent protein associated domain-containing protein n=1 Tax=viral metagenome TaxID=1070528 RepID=A0A6M3JE89_9ZZZZ